MAEMSSTPIKLSSELSQIYFGLFPFYSSLIFLSYATALGLLKSFYQIPRLKSSLKFDLQSVQKILNLAMEIECIFLQLLLCAKRKIFYSPHSRIGRKKNSFEWIRKFRQLKIQKIVNVKIRQEIFFHILES